MVNDRREVPLRQVVILDTNYQIECSNGLALSERLPIEIENRVRNLTMSWRTDKRNCPERFCILPSGLLMRVFFLAGTDAWRIGVTLEPFH